METKKLPYEILKTACELYAGKTGFTQAEMKDFFAEEVKKSEQPLYSLDNSSGWNVLFNALERGRLDMRRNPRTFHTRTEALEYWLSLLPIAMQKEILLYLCRKPDFPMSKGKPSQEDRDKLAALLNNFVLDTRVSSELRVLNSSSIINTWQKAIHRCATDPEGAITAARTLLEGVCKLILDERGEEYDDKTDLPKLYSLATNELHIAPSQQTEPIMRQILGGCQSIVEGVGALRNRLGDAHGKGRTSVKPSPYHAELAVNCAGSTALFLLQMWKWDSQLSVG